MQGRIFLGQDKQNDDYDFFYRQDVIKPALVGLAGPRRRGDHRSQRGDELVAGTDVTSFVNQPQYADDFPADGFVFTQGRTTKSTEDSPRVCSLITGSGFLSTSGWLSTISRSTRSAWAGTFVNSTVNPDRSTFFRSCAMT